jgi:hypothetical protein
VERLPPDFVELRVNHPPASFVACAGFTSQQCLYPVEIREIGKELQLAGLELCRETCHEETP